MRVVCPIALLAALLATTPTAADTTTTSTSSTTSSTSATATTSTTTTTLPPTTADQICPPNADPCVVSGDKPVSPGSTLDFGTRALVLKNGASLFLTAPGGMTIHAGSLTLNATAALRGAGSGKGEISVTVPGDIQLLAGSTIDVSADDAGDWMIDLSAGGVAVVNGALKAAATDIFGSGGTIDVTAAGDLTVNETITAKGGGQAGGGFVTLTSDTAAVAVNQPIDATGGDSNYSEIDIESNTDMIVKGRLDVSATNGGLSGSGGTVCLTSDNGGIQVLGPVVGRGQGSDPDLAGGGDGGELDVFASTDITVDGQVTLSGGGGDGCGGIVNIDTDVGDISVTQPIQAQGNGLDSCAQDGVTLTAGGNLAFKSVDVHTSEGGNVDAEASGAITVTGNINADGGGVDFGGSITVLAGTSALVSGNLHANVGYGLIDVEACDLTLTRDAQLSAKDNRGKNTLAASGQMTVAGTLVAAVENRLEYLDPSKPPIFLTGAIFTPAPVIVLDPALLPCPTTTTSTTSTSVTTITTVVTTTSTSATTTTQPPLCSPPDCDDGDPCTIDQCLTATGRCSNVPRQGFDAVTCRLRAIHVKALAAPPDAIRSAKLRQKIITKADKVRGLVDAARGGGRRGKASFRRASRGLGALARMIGKGQAKGKIEGTVGRELLGLATSAKSDLQQLSVP